MSDLALTVLQSEKKRGKYIWIVLHRFTTLSKPSRKFLIKFPFVWKLLKTKFWTLKGALIEFNTFKKLYWNEFNFSKKVNWNWNPHFVDYQRFASEWSVHWSKLLKPNSRTIFSEIAINYGLLHFSATEEF